MYTISGLIPVLSFNSNDNTKILTQVDLELTGDIPSILSRYMRQGEGAEGELNMWELKSAWKHKDISSRM